jgi:hypothetical protein
MEEVSDAERMRELGLLHLRLEAERRLEPLLETLAAAPVLEFHPLGLRLRGAERVRRFYDQYFRTFLTAIEGYATIDEWANERSYAQEYDVAVRIEAQLEAYRVLTILFSTDGAVFAGRRIYANDRAIKLMLGELYSELEPLD